MASLKPIKTRLENVEEEEDIEILSPTARALHTGKLNAFIIVEMGIKTAIDVEMLKKGTIQSILKHPRFTGKLVYDEDGKAYGWIQTKVNMDEHVIIPDFDPNMKSPDQFIEDYASNITKKPMDFSKPLWEFHVLNIKTSRVNAVFFLRVHHSLGDGISLISLLLACTRKSSDPEALPSLLINNIKNKNKSQRKKSCLTKCFHKSLLFFRVSRNTLVDISLFTATMMCLKDTNTLVKDPPSAEQSPRRFVHRTFGLDDVKFVKNSMNMTVNDVILGITQGGLSIYLNRKYGKDMGDKKDQENNLSKHMIRLRANIAVNLRPTNNIENLAECMEEEVSSKRQWKWGNKIGYVIIPFHIALKNDPLDHIRDAKATIDRKKESLGAVCASALTKFAVKALGLKLSGSVTQKILSNTTLTFSNVVGPMEEITFYGHPVAYLAPSVYGLPPPLTVHFQSYMDTMTCVLSVDPDVIPDPWKLCDDVVDYLQLAKNAVVERQLTKL